MFLFGGVMAMLVGLLFGLSATFTKTVVEELHVSIEEVLSNWSFYGLIGFAVAGIGAGEISLDNALGLDIAGIGWALGALALGLLGGAGAVLAGRATTHRTTSPGATASTG